MTVPLLHSYGGDRTALRWLSIVRAIIRAALAGAGRRIVKSMRVEINFADQTRIANGYKSYATLAPIVGQCLLPTHTWRKSNCTDELNAAIFNCQVRNSALRACVPATHAVTSGGYHGYCCR